MVHMACLAEETIFAFLPFSQGERHVQTDQTRLEVIYIAQTTAFKMVLSW